MPKPNLFVIGAMKCGTTTINGLLELHPRVFMCPHKDLLYFCDRLQVRREWPGAGYSKFVESESAYLAMFAKAGGATVIGESSAGYARIPTYDGVPERIHAFNPDAKLIYMIRDPVQRTLSHYWHAVRMGRERRPMDQAVRDPYYTDVSYYAKQLRAYLEVFPRDQIMVLTLEELTRDTNQVFGQVLAWLGLDPKEAPADAGLHLNKGEEEGTIRHPLVRKLQATLLWKEAKGLVPSGLKSSVVRLLSRERYDRKSVDHGPVREYLRGLHQKQTEELVQLLGRDFPDWRMLASAAA